MYAVVKAGSRQFKVKEGETLIIDRVPGNAGDSYVFDQVLMIGGDKVTVGAPLVAGAKVEAKIKSQGKGEKLMVFKYKRRKNYKKSHGHRQPISVLEIGKIKA
jgi:large subunit ribosomal protein L21